MKKFKRVLLIAANALCVLGILAGVYAFTAIRKTQLSQRAAERWRGESDMRFAQVSVFTPANAALSESGIRTFRNTIDGKLAEAGVQEPETGSLWRDAWCSVGTASAATSRGSVTAQAYGVGGDFFLFHPLRLLSGQYLRPDDLMDDRVVINEMLAWKLYGGSDLAGMTVTVNGAEYVIVGVVRTEDDFAAKHALSEDAMLLFMDYSRLSQPAAAAGENAAPAADVTCYELVMPDPLSGYAKGFVQNGLGGGSGVLTVENSARFTVGGIRETIRLFGERVMRQTPVALPYWENAALYTETLLSGVLLLTALLRILPAVTALWLLVKGWRLAKRAAKSGAHRAGAAIESRREKRWEKKEAQKRAAKELAAGKKPELPPEPEQKEIPAPKTAPALPAGEPEDGDMEDVNRIVREILEEKSK